jgi:hypothetical protein
MGKRTALVFGSIQLQPDHQAHQKVSGVEMLASIVNQHTFCVFL